MLRGGASDQELEAELRRIFEGPTWSYVCLESDVARPGDFRTTFVGTMPVIVARGEDGAVHAFENRCAHRGALIALDDAGTAKHFQCIYHAWTYDLRGNLTGVAFEKVRAVYDDIMATRKVDRVNNFWKAMARHPAQMKRLWSHAKAAMGRAPSGRISGRPR